MYDLVFVGILIRCCKKINKFIGKSLYLDSRISPTTTDKKKKKNYTNASEHTEEFFSFKT